MDRINFKILKKCLEMGRKEFPLHKFQLRVLFLYLKPLKPFITIKTIY
jgi:hypothetical protein